MGGCGDGPHRHTARVRVHSLGLCISSTAYLVLPVHGAGVAGVAVVQLLAVS